MKDNENSYNNNMSELDEEKVNYQEILFKYIIHWPWFIASVLACLIGAWVYLHFQTPVYQVSASIMIKNDKKNGGGNTADLEKEWIIYTTGVVPAISAVIKALTLPGDKVMVQTPVYNCFFSSIRNNGCEMIANPLVYRNRGYQIDLDDLERKTLDPKVKLLLLCNPHNPAGRVWSKQELRRIGEICLRNNVFVVADEIHCELVFLGHEYTPFASISEEFLLNSVTFVSPSKAFNLAGLQIANIISADADVRVRINKAINMNEVCDVNPFGVEALIAAYNEGEEWLEELKIYLFANYIYLKGYFETYLPEFPVMMLEGTYLVWVDCSVLHQASEEIVKDLLKKEKLWVNEGSLYGEAGEGFIRINIACPRQRLIDGLNRLKRALK